MKAFWTIITTPGSWCGFWLNQFNYSHYRKEVFITKGEGIGLGVTGVWGIRVKWRHNTDLPVACCSGTLVVELGRCRSDQPDWVWCRSAELFDPWRTLGGTRLAPLPGTMFPVISDAMFSTFCCISVEHKCNLRTCCGESRQLNHILGVHWTYFLDPRA